MAGACHLWLAATWGGGALPLRLVRPCRARVPGPARRLRAIGRDFRMYHTVGIVNGSMPSSTVPGPRDALDQLMYADETVRIGLFDCPRDHPRFCDSGPASGDLVVFPRDAVEIAHPRRAPVVASPQVTTLYNRGQEYRRRALSPYGDRALWLHFRRETVIEALIDAGRTHPRLEHSPFAWTYSDCASTSYLKARQLLRLLREPRPVAAMAIVETASALLAETIRTAPRHEFPAARSRPATRARHRRLTRQCCELLASRFGEPLTLAGIARDLATTPFHLSRVFSRYSGQTLHAYLMSLRLRVAGDRLIEQPCRLADISADLVFATPSHFSQRFRHTFGCSPSTFRRRLGLPPG